MFVARKSNNKGTSTTKKNKKKKKTCCGRGLLNKVVNKGIDLLPFEAHIPGYQYCGPGTRLEKRLKRGDPGINPLDKACKEHDIAYQETDSNTRREADRVLASKAWARVKSRDASVRERLAALAVAGIMKGKVKLGAGKQRKQRRKNNLSLAIRKAQTALSHLAPGVSIKQAATAALKAARKAVGSNKNNNSVGKRKRVIPIPQKKVGGIIPLIPLFAGLSALGSLAGGAAGVVNAINKAKKARDQLSEMQRHNHVMEAVALRGGKGLYLAPYKKGLGLYL